MKRKKIDAVIPSIAETDESQAEQSDFETVSAETLEEQPDVSSAQEENSSEE